MFTFSKLTPSHFPLSTASFAGHTQHGLGVLSEALTIPKHYHSNPGVPEGEGQHHVGQEGGSNCTQNPDDVLPSFIHQESKYWGHGS